SLVSCIYKDLRRMGCASAGLHTISRAPIATPRLEPHAVFPQETRNADRQRRPQRPPGADPDGEHTLPQQRTLKGPYPQGLETAMFGLGCFWGAERMFWQMGDGIWVTAVGYAGGITPNPTYEEVCTGRTGHNEVVLVVFDPTKISYEALLKT